MSINGAALRAIRQRSGLSVTALAGAIGISQPHLSNIENGDRKASPQVIRKLADELKVPVTAILLGATEPVA